MSLVAWFQYILSNFILNFYQNVLESIFSLLHCNDYSSIIMAILELNM